ncbi:MAG: hypothetical protein PHV34_15770 [Verrucomicrobiae bacterium]|nr:hypothetical protein [Verrucomicrobiae bacterium]
MPPRIGNFCAAPKGLMRLKIRLDNICLIAKTVHWIGNPPELARDAIRYGDHGQRG